MTNSRPFYIATFDDRDTGQAVAVVIDRRGDPIRIEISGEKAEVALRTGAAFRLADGIRAAALAAVDAEKRRQVQTERAERPSTSRLPAPPATADELDGDSEEDDQGF